MPQRFDNKVIFITGAASGIGLATTKKLAALGGILCLCDINSTHLSTAVHEILSTNPELNVLSEAFDIGSNTECKAFVSKIIDKHGHIDHVFNCAGVNPTKLPTAEIDDEYWDKLVNTNLKGLFNTTRACIPHLPSGSSFVNVASIAGIKPTSGFAVYCATKYGIIGFSKCIALELGGKGIRTNIIAPGYIDTPSNASVVAGKDSVEKDVKGISMGRFGTAEEVADVAVFLFSEEARYMNGSVVEVHGGI